MINDNLVTFLDINAIEDLYEKYKENSDSVDESFKYFFQGFDLAKDNSINVVIESQKTDAVLAQHSKENTKSDGVSKKEIAVTELISGYRSRGHLFTKTNPVRTRRSYSPTLDIENFGLSKDDLEITFEAGQQIGIGRAKLKDIIAHLNETYCKSIGVEFRYMTKPDIVNWLQSRMEGSKNQEFLSNSERSYILDKLIEASGFEDFLHKKFVGQKRFSLEGSEAILPALDVMIAHGGQFDVKEIFIGMAHRGRLNILTNIMKMPYSDIFRGFIAENYNEGIKYGDVKYHLGYNNNFEYNGRNISINLAPNPSHLETVGPIVEGMAKAKLVNEYNENYDSVLPIIIHGDAAIAGQGVVYETIQFSKLDGYKTGGTIHIVINNQVGFTTNYLEARSSTYCTDVAKVTQSPVFHVNGDDIEAVIYVTKLALEFRQKFNIDVFIDLLSYRKYGHNEGDEPRFTQPKLYDIIANHKNPRDLYAEKLIGLGIIDRKEFNNKIAQYELILETSFGEAVKSKQMSIKPFLENSYKNIKFPVSEDFERNTQTKISQELFLQLVNQITHLPDGMKFYNKTIRLFEQRRQMVINDQYDWAMGELMAYASLSKEMYPVRLSGQDSVRGTFSHRHAEIITEDGEEKYYPLNSLDGKHSVVQVFNSPLNEYGILGFEYGYSIALPNGLTIWEAQFGDFFNVGQVIVDQYISSAKEKWGVRSGLVLFLPHGYEGQGAEHSSGRIERFLSMCANYNMQIVNPTTPANFFHVLRRQMHRHIRVPLICFTPKSLLRHPECTSTLADFTEGHFMKIIVEHKFQVKSDIKRVLICSGKIFYELNDARKIQNAFHVAIIRIEQLYPFPKGQLIEILESYDDDTELIWVQEEPLNMGAANFIKNNLYDLNIRFIGRPESGVTAEGLTNLHKTHQSKIINDAIK
ncbi:2-oxoglutarate dehydrogenase E1 component [Paludibacter sp.]